MAINKQDNKRAGNFTVAFLSDIHLFDKAPLDSDLDAYQAYQSSRMYWDANERFAAAVQKVNACQPDMIIITGDIIDHVSPANVRLYTEMRKTLVADVYPVQGNHDHATIVVHKKTNGEPDPQWGFLERETRDREWRGVFPDNKFDYSFTYGGFRFIVVDNGRNQLTIEQLHWLEDELTSAPESRTFVCNHVPLRTPATMDTLHRVWADNESLVIPHSDPQFELLLAYRSKIACVFSGHLHTFSDDCVEGIRQIVCPMTAHSPDSFLLCNFSPETGDFHSISARASSDQVSP